jgi:hypothetical protein
MPTSKRARRDRDAVQARVPEQLLAAGLCRAPASPRAAPDGRVSPVWVAVSRERIYAFEARPEAVGELVGTWERQGAVVETTPTLTATRVSLRPGAHGPRLDLASRRLRIANHHLLRYLLNPDRIT